MKKFLKRLVIIISSSYLLICTLTYFMQERLIFHPEKLSVDYAFDFDEAHEELWLETADGTRLNAILFKSDSAKGLVIHYHGNAGSVRTWGNGSQRYTEKGYDVCVMDYRGFGKSEGEIQSETLLFEDAQLLYDLMKSRYHESDIIIEGYSIGSGIAAKIAAENNPSQLILCAPYYSLKDLMGHTYPILPQFLLKYPLDTYERLPEIIAPITLFHGTNDEVIPFNSSERLFELKKENDRFIPLEGCDHNSVQIHPTYNASLSNILLTN